MAQPPAYPPQTEFLVYQAQQAWFPGQQLDVEFNALSASVEAIETNLNIIQRDDGQLANGSVGVDQLNATLRLQLTGASFTPVPALQGPLNLTASGVNQGLLVLQTASGGIATGSFQHYLNLFSVTSDTVAMTAPAGGLNALGVTYNFGGSTVAGARTGFLSVVTQTAPTNASNPFPAYTAMAGVTFVDGVGDGGTNTGAGARGTYFGANPQVRSTATNVLEVVGQETNVWGSSTATQTYQLCHSAVGIFANNGVTLDAAYELHMGASAPYGAAAAPGPGFGYGFVAAELSNGYVPIAPTGTLLGVYLGSLSTVPVAYGIDIRKLTASQKQIAGVGFSIDPVGQPTFGAGSGTVFEIINGGQGTGSAGAGLAIENAGAGVVSFGNVSALFGGAYSNIGAVTGFFGLNLYTNNTIAVTIDTSQKVTFAGLVTTPASASGGAGFNIQAGSAPTSPNNGDMWQDGTNVKIRIGGVTKTFTIT